MDKGKLGIKTPVEISGSLKLSQYVENDKEFTEIYQKARYSQTNISKEDVLKIKKNRK